MSYDQVGNLTNDTYTGEGTRTFDAENRMRQAWANGQWQIYSYDGSGKRIKRSVNGTETWQVYGLGGELLAEYAANAAASSPQKEYGYRNGELLITADAPAGARTNVALASSGATATASSTYPPSGSFVPSPAGAIDGEHQGTNYLTTGTWHSSSPTVPQWLEIQFNGSKSIDEIDVFSCQDNYTNPSPPTESMTFSLYGLTAFDVQYWNGSNWVTVPGGAVTGNNKVWKKITFASITTSRIRVVVNATVDGWSRAVEVEAWTAASGAASVRWLVTDQLGTPRMVVDQTGVLANISRHDYLPFGEDMPANFRTGIPGYATGDNVRQKFTGYEADAETGLNFAEARYQSNSQGRFTSPDPFGGSMRPIDPQSFNRYSYTGNNPINRTDSSGLDWTTDARFHGQWDIAHQTMADVDRARASNGSDEKDFEGTIEPAYPKSEPEAGPQEIVTIEVVDRVQS